MASTLLLPPYRHHAALSLLSNTQDPPITRGLMGPTPVLAESCGEHNKAGTLLPAGILLWLVPYYFLLLTG